MRLLTRCSVTPLAALAVSAALLAACSKPAADAPKAATPAASVTEAPPDRADAGPAAASTEHVGIAWRYAASDADVDAAFALAKAEAKPVFVYWGAKWCPPCNQVKATLFNRQDFIERSRAFVPVYVDGDSPGAQKLGARFKVGGYPTMVLFNPQGAELTRLPGEVEAERYTQVLTLGMNAQRPVKAVLADALAGAQSLTPNDWRLLAFYAWDTDEQQLVPQAGVPKLLQQLAAACPADQAEAAMRLRLKALAAIGEKAAAKWPDPAAQAMLQKLLADPAAVRAHLDVVTNAAADITRAVSLAGTPQRAQLVEAFNGALQRVEADASLSRADRLTALGARVDLAKLDWPSTKAAPGAATSALSAASPSALPSAMPDALPDALLADVRAHAARDDREITNGYERQAVITGAAYVLEEAGLSAESDALLKANLAKSHSPYYLMSALGSNAKKRGDKAEALHWFGEAFAKSEGAATRLQWGAAYVKALVELAPADEGLIERTAGQVLREAAAMPDAFYERSGRSLQRLGKQLMDWNKAGAHDAALKRLQAQLAGMCAAFDAADAQRASCDAVFKPAAPQAVKRS